jgi:hypothetical protein
VISLEDIRKDAQELLKQANAVEKKAHKLRREAENMVKQIHKERLAKRAEKTDAFVINGNITFSEHFCIKLTAAERSYFKAVDADVHVLFNQRNTFWNKILALRQLSTAYYADTLPEIK